MRLVAVGNFKDGEFRLETEDGVRIDNPVLDWTLLDRELPVDESRIVFQVVFDPREVIDA